MWKRNATATNSDVPRDEETQEIPFPELNPGAEYLVSFFYSAGTAMQTGMGLVPLTWQEIDAWCKRTANDDLTPWEAETLRRMSEAYCTQYVKAGQKLCRMPYSPSVDLDELDRAAVSQKIANVLKQFKKKEE